VPFASREGIRISTGDTLFRRRLYLKDGDRHGRLTRSLVGKISRTAAGWGVSK